ncbi:hypothetical protein TPHA_0E01260 [Tetrapisispora phaffii CBS 4417]|uniref:Mediator of RNA polymerase II transcription subunit 6 n=1 Tax=Tetrapisispora phaffii (strain ATCC 24235 / CBS 4417 / NBRC 1672 / NRRL Y-8282 / UCD 70-5) TaxID=1071381 RepID=G8BTJ3_TETPH|nr:hypothetical protein TPHA_0E01260 [Tetrapisispora phaffii CBS 4417]CCE63221.1 hypothetical protein TPHA_0E01260 [Tetrapisispora phaffii CBS 4417]
MDTPLDELQWKSPEWIQAFGLHTDNVMDYFSESPFFNKVSNNQVIRMQKQFSQVPSQQPQQQVNKQCGSDNDNNTGELESGDAKDGAGGQSQMQSQLDIFKSSLDDRSTDQEFEHVGPSRREILLKYPSQAMMERELSKMTGLEYVLAYVREPDLWIIKKQNRISAETTQTLQAYYIIGANVYQSPSAFNIIQSRLLSASYHISSMLENLHKVTMFEPSQGVQIRPTYENATGNTNTNSNTNPNGILRTNAPATSAIAGNTAPPTNSINSVASTNINTSSKTMAINTANTANTAMGTTRYDPNQRELLPKEMMDTLLAISIKSTPEYI